MKNPLRSSRFARFLLPGFCFQSMIIAGGYGTGREIVEFFMASGVRGGLLGMTLITMPLWSLLCALAFEVARRARAYDYRSFARELLGPLEWVYEVLYLAAMLVVVSVVAAAGGEIVSRSLGLPYLAGVLAIAAAVGWLTFRGTGAVERFLSFWSLALYAVYLALLAAAFQAFGPEISEAVRSGTVGSGWVRGGAEYMAYNIGTLPAVLFCARHLTSRRDAAIAGAAAGFIGIFPAVLFFVAISGFSVEVLNEAVPSVYLLERIGSPLLSVAFQVILFGTLVETATSLIHAVNERLARTLEERRRSLPSGFRPAVSTAALLLAVLLAQAGLGSLIGVGYRILTYGFWLVFVLPLLGVGLHRLLRAR